MLHAVRLWFCILALAATLAAQSPPSEPAAGMTVAQALALRAVTNPRLGDDFVAFTLVVPRPLADGPGGNYLHLGVIDGLERIRAGAAAAVRWLVAGKDTASSMQVRPGRREVSFLRSVGGSAQLFVQPIDGGQAQRWAVTPAITAYRWRPDGRAISFTALDPPPPARAQAQARGIRPVVVDEDWRHLSLWLVEQDGEPGRLTSGTTVFEHEWAPDGKSIACACAPRNLVDDSYMFQRLHVLDVATGALERLVDNPGKLGAFAWSPDGRQLAYVTALDRNDPHAGLLAFVDIATRESRLWPRRGGAAATAASMVTDVQWVGDSPHCIEHHGVASAVRTAGELTVAAGREHKGRAGHVTAYAVSRHYLITVVGTPQHPPELFLDGHGRLTDSNPELAGVALGEQTVEVVRARDGLEIEGLLIKPVGYEPGRRYPFVIVAHGGPEAHFSDGWLTNYGDWGQLLAARGYMSWYPNYRSSTGYGTAFCKHDHGDPMGKEFLDHLDAIDHFDRKGLIDRERVGIGGGSYGGYTAAWAATRHSAHFAAAVSFVPFVDIRTKWLTSDIPWEFYYVHYQELWPWQQPGLLADRSPLTWAAHCRTPLLLLGGTQDTRVDPSQPLMLYRAVKFATDTPVRCVQYPGEGHGNRTNAYRLDYVLRTLQWFDHYLLGDGDRRTKAMPPLDLDYGG